MSSSGEPCLRDTRYTASTQLLAFHYAQEFGGASSSTLQFKGLARDLNDNITSEAVLWSVADGAQKLGPAAQAFVEDPDRDIWKTDQEPEPDVGSLVADGVTVGGFGGLRWGVSASVTCYWSLDCDLSAATGAGFGGSGGVGPVCGEPAPDGTSELLTAQGALLGLGASIVDNLGPYPPDDSSTDADHSLSYSLTVGPGIGVFFGPGASWGWSFR